MFAERLKIARGGKGFTQQAVADCIGIKLAAYQHYEYNVRKPSFEVLVKLCLLLDVSSDWLLGLSDTRGRQP